ncbi:MAG: asparagine synthase-related protein [Methanoregula sp.]
MPGLIGFTRENNDWGKEVLFQMCKIITYKNNYTCDEIFSDKCIFGTRVHLNIIQKNQQPFSESGIYIWLDGEFYNQEDFSENISDDVISDVKILFTLFKKNSDFSFLKRIDGIFSAVIYDSNTDKIYLINDRFGLRYLYWTIFSDSLIWCSELKVLLEIPNYVPKINLRTLEEFFSIGYPLENNTWFEDVFLLPSGSVLCYDIKEKNHVIERYWWWDEIKPLVGKIDEDFVVEKLGDLFIKSVQRRCKKNESIGLTLSGGLDSRAILAAIPQDQHPLYSITFGQKNCIDVKYAKMAAEKKGENHVFFELNSNNWLISRIKGVWWTDGQLNLMHMHGIDTIDVMRKYFDININGFAGDLILGGSYLKKEYLDNALDKKLLEKLFGNFIFNIREYETLRKIDFFFIQNRVRRFTHGGTKYLSTNIEQRKPFFDNELIEFTYSLPDKFRYNHYIYNKMLLKKFPVFFQTIPWQKTGYPITYSGTSLKILSYYKILSNFIVCFMQKFGFKYGDSREYTNYPEWIRQDPAKQFFISVLLDNNALYSKYISKESVITKLNEHFEGKNHAEDLCGYLTFEIWLQQVFNKKYR